MRFRLTDSINPALLQPLNEHGQVTLITGAYYSAFTVSFVPYGHMRLLAQLRVIERN